MTIEEFNTERKKIDALKESLAKDTGANEQALLSLKQYNVSTIEEAENLLTTNKQKKELASAELSSLLAEFEGIADDL